MFVHSKLGPCVSLIHFEGEKNQLRLVRSASTANSKGITLIKDRQKPRHWLLWGPKEAPIEKLGKTCLTYSNGWRHSQSKAMEVFMQATKTLDNMEFIHRG